mmetsp:Transcript_41894/g.48468  ORF Transcript_41894/g.48468 Transcript_41894/m.48468 type:complete len:133 (-) Transcript_41894:18-416(-)
MNVDVFENALELTTSEFDSIFHYTGEFKTLLNSSRSTVNVMGLNREPIIRGGAKKTIKMVAKLDNLGPDKPNNDVVMVGIRVCVYNAEKFGSADAEEKLSLKLFNRTINLKPNQKTYEIGFCDAEMLYLHLV